MTVIEIDGMYSGINFSACHFIPHHEKCSRLHGHGYIMRLRLEGEIGKDGMVMDFVVLKKKLREMAEEMDHRVLVPSRSDIVKVSTEGKTVKISFTGKEYAFPLSDVKFLDVPTTTAEEMSKMMAERIVKEVNFPKNIRSVSVGLDEERGQTAWSEVVLK